MRLSHEQLINLPVYVEDNTFLGHIVGFELDATHHVVVTYYVGKHKLVNELLNTFVGTSALRVATGQVVSLSVEKMIVRSTAIPTDSEEMMFQPINSAIDPSTSS